MHSKSPKLVSDTGPGRGMRCDEAPILKVSEYQGCWQTTPVAISQGPGRGMRCDEAPILKVSEYQGCWQTTPVAISQGLLKRKETKWKRWMWRNVDPGCPVVNILATGSEIRGFKPGRDRWIFQSVKILSMTSFGSGSHVVDLRHVKEPQAEIRASEQNLSDFSRSLSKATLMTRDVKSVVKPKPTTNVEKWWNEICGSKKREKPEKNHPDFVSSTMKPTWSDRDANSTSQR